MARAFVLVLMALASLTAFGRGGNLGPQPGIVTTLKNSFINDFKDRVTIDAKYTVDKAHAHPNAPAKDGDMHIAGRAPETAPGMGVRLSCR